MEGNLFFFDPAFLKDTLNHVQKNIQLNRYKKLSPDQSEIIRQHYASKITAPLDLGDEYMVYTKEGLQIANGYNRIVIGDYGSYVEFTDQQIIKASIRVKPSQRYRLDQKSYPNIKYIWYEVVDDPEIKVYYQLKSVNYADYVPGRYYISSDDLVYMYRQREQKGGV